MKYGLALFCDELAEFKTDQIALIDRVLESFDDVSQLRSRSVCSQNTNTMLQYVRSSYSDIHNWCKSFTLSDKPVYAYVLCGLSELGGGGSYYWNDRHLECLIVELLAHKFEIVLVTTTIKGLDKSKQNWQNKYKERCRELATKHDCDTLNVKGLRSMNFKAREVERISQSIAKDLKARYADTVISVVPKVESKPPRKRLRPSATMTKPKRTKVVKAPVPVVAPTPPKKTRKRTKRVSTVKIERF